MGRYPSTDASSMTSADSHRAPGVRDGSPDQPSPALDERDYQLVRDAKAKRRKIDVAIGVATFNGWGLAIFAALSAPLVLLSFSFIGLVICLGLGLTAYYEFQGRKMLQQLDAGGARLLGHNQIGLGVLIIVYCVWNLIAAMLGPGRYAEVIEQTPEVAHVLGSMDELFRFAEFAIYGMVIVLTVPYQGLMAWYYYSRAKHVRHYVKQTPDWITQMQKAAA